MSAPSRRRLFGAATAFAALAGTPGLPASSRRPTPSGEFLDMTRTFRAADDACDALDHRCLRAPAGSPEHEALDQAMLAASRERQELHDEVFYHRPRTLADVAVMAGHAISNLEYSRESNLLYSLLSGDLEATLADMQRAFAGILAVVAPAAGIDVADIGWSNMPRTYRRALAELED